jgi:hypothetical protein
MINIKTKTDVKIADPVDKKNNNIVEIIDKYIKEHTLDELLTKPYFMLEKNIFLENIKTLDTIISKNELEGLMFPRDDNKDNSDISLNFFKQKKFF